jgi:hypothetical protein
VSDVILIAGYYRSGTSALAGALQRMGVTLHNDAEANEHNPLGFYEIPELIEWDVNLFQHLGVDWTDVRGLPDGWWERADIARHFSKLDEILRRRFAAEPLWGLKHPHLCRLFPIYERAITQAGHKPHVIHICRAPWTVATSQQRKNNLSRAHAVLLWLTYLVSAERNARHLPRSWLTYQDLLANPAAQIDRLEKDLGLSLRNRVPDGLAQARSFLTSQLNRSEPAPQSDLFRPLQSLAEQVWEAVQARDTAPATWDGFAAATAEIVGFLKEIGTSRGTVVPGFGPVQNAAAGVRAPASLRPPERTDEGAKQRLLALQAAAGPLPSLHVIIAVPPERAHAIHDTLEALRGQWLAPAAITLVAADPIELPDIAVIPAPAEAGGVTAALCEAANAAAQSADYVALINAGDIITPDACLRFALEAANGAPDMLYSDETVQNDNGAWIRFKPGWDVTRLRQAAYIGDWVWYRSATLRRLGGFSAAAAGAEEYDYQLRLAEHAPMVRRLAEALFTRAPLSRRDNIPSTVFGERASEAVREHLARAGIPAVVAPRQHLGLFRHERAVADPGTSTILLCSGADVPMLDRWLKDLLSNFVQTGPIILAGAALSPQVEHYLAQVAEQTEALEGKVLAVRPQPGLTEAGALAQAMALAGGELVAVLDARLLPATPDWMVALRTRLADPGVALASARDLVQMASEPGRFLQQGPIILGADSRMGAGHVAEDPGLGGWLAVDQEASAVAPGALLARRAQLAACTLPALTGDALWIDICAQLRASGGRIVWTPDVSFAGGAERVQVDAACSFRNGGPAARALPWADDYHHPALSLRGNLLLAEQRLGLVPASPADAQSVLLTGAVNDGMPLLNALRAIRSAGLAEASWAPDQPSVAELGRRAASAWVRINPAEPATSGAPPYTGFFTRAPKPEAKPALAAAAQLVATSPALVKQVKKLLPPSREVALWRPALSRPLWEGLTLGTGLNTNPRVLWIDEGIAPAWLTELMNETLSSISWIVVERAGTQYSGSVARLSAPAHEQGWAQELAALAPHILLRPAESEVAGDHYPALMAAAAGCHILTDERLDLPETLGAVRLPNRLAAWQKALQRAVGDLKSTLELGAQARAAALALPSVETLPPPWEVAEAARQAAE